MTYDLFLGCVIPARLPFLEASARKVFQKLDIKLNDVDGFSCCPDPTGIEEISHDAWLVLGARNLSLCNKNGGVMSLCSGCVETLKGVNHHLHNHPEQMKIINEQLKKIGRKYDGKVNVRHFAQVLYQNIDLVRKNVVKQLAGLKIAVHYGCHYLRPSEVIGWDDPFEPVTIDKLVETLGAESIDYSYKMECCGNPVTKSDKNLSLLMLSKKLEAIKESGANCIAVVCPACYQQFDFSQREVNKQYNTSFELPIFYLSELVALAFGFPPADLGLSFHTTKTAGLLESIQLSK
jgi:heterodisulfide reductase subunit B